MSFSGSSLLMISVKWRDREAEAMFEHQHWRQKGKKFSKVLDVHSFTQNMITTQHPVVSLPGQ